MNPEPLADDTAYRSVSSTSFNEILDHVQASLIVSTYQSGRIVLVRPRTDGALNTHFRAFGSPMGVAVGRRSLAIACAREVWDYRNQPDVAPRLDPPGEHDACFFPRNVHVTGDMRVHEVAFTGDDELWAVNTQFSSLCTLDDTHSFVPRWRPRFVSDLAPEDRCHLNGLGMVDGRPRFVTAFGETNTAGGWRENKVGGGVVMDVDSGETVVRGLCMPHSPRWYDGRFWFLESGRGTFACADLATGRVETVAELPGFTRGLAFCGPFAFIGLSQVRESATFGGIPLVERVPERECGVWVIDIRSGRPAAFLRFEGQVQEIFDVQVLHGIRCPELFPLAAKEVATLYVVPPPSALQPSAATRPRARAGSRSARLRSERA
ncbi:MAG TPA: TIGR03032 family protein [Longimicrobium sp.]